MVFVLGRLIFKNELKQRSVKMKKEINYVNRSSNLKRAALVLGLTVTLDIHAAGISSDPGDYKALPAGTNLAVAYYQHMEADNVYANGNKVADNLGMGIDLGMLRYVHFMEIGNWVMDPQFIVPYARQHSNSGEDITGFGDLIVGGVTWPYRDDKKGRYFAFGGFVTVPTGSNKTRGFAISNDRYQYNIQAGYQHALTNKIILEGIGQFEFYSQQEYTNIKKDVFFQTDFSAIYKVTNNSNLAVTWRHTDGGKEKVNGATARGNDRKDTFLLSASTNLKPNLQLLLQWRQDVNVDNGVKISGPQSRLVYAF